MKTLNRIPFSLIALSLLMTFSLISCASWDKNFRDDDYPTGKLTSDEYERLGDIYFNKGDSINAFVHYEKSLSSDPDNSRVHYKKGLLFVVEGKREDA
jgi:Tfp pilus assembly protein PilF